MKKQTPREYFHGRVPPISNHHAEGEEDYTSQPSEPFDYDRNPSWRIFRIMAEFVDGFNFITQFKKTVTFFGSARFDEQDEHYRAAQKLAHLLVKEGYSIVTGGGPGIMEAANRGAAEGKGQSIGLNIQLPFEQRTNTYVRRSMAFNFFFVRKVMLAFSARAFVFFPGGYGTLDEAFEMLTLRQTLKINPRIPVILVGRDFWGPLAEWILDNAVKKHKTIEADEFELFDVVDTPEEALEIIKKTPLDTGASKSAQPAI